MGILNASNAFGTQSTFMNNTAVTDSIITLGSDNAVSYTGQPYVAYAWHSVDGFSSVENYIGNGSANGPVIYTDFKPAFVLIKRTDSTGNWHLFDSTRGPNNVVGETLYPDLNFIEQNVDALDLMSNGFKIRTTDANLNSGGANYIYLAFAEAPTNAGFGAVVNAR